MTTVGSLFTGYGGLDMGVMIALDSSARIAWTSDVEPGPCKLAAGYGLNLHEIATSADLTEFGPYAEAIARWEKVTGRAAPPPSTPSRRPGGKPQLSTRFVEWLMGLPDGHVTGTDLALPRKQQLRLLGNGVVPQQAALAVRTLTETALRYGAAQ